MAFDTHRKDGLPKLLRLVASASIITMCGSLIFGSTGAFAEIPKDKIPGYITRDKVITRGVPLGAKWKNLSKQEIANGLRTLNNSLDMNSARDLLPDRYKYLFNNSLDLSKIYFVRSESDPWPNLITRTLNNPARFCAKYGSDRCYFIGSQLKA